ncbi:MAG TPA: hypothetical protein VH560_13790, partial [Polyangia bacterium]|nr:hypothetical protein [Polyangia bacterium]
MGTIVTRGDVDRVSVLRADAAYPGALGDDTQWLEAAHESGHEISVWVMPPGTRARAIRFTTTATGNDRPLVGHLVGASVLSERFANVAPQALAFASSAQHDAAWITDGTWREWTSDDSERTAPVSPAHPESVVLLWDRPVTLRGLCALWPGFGAADAQIYVGPRDVHPREARDDAWKTLVTLPLAHRYPEVFVPNWIDFGRSVTTRAIRLRFTAPADESGHYLRGKTHAGKLGWLGELLALSDLHGAPVPAPASAPAPHPPIAVPFTMKAPGFATLVIEDAAGRRVRNLVGDTWFAAGAQVAWWDGLDESGRAMGPFAGINKTVGAPVAPGRYRVRGLVHGPIGLHYELSVNSPGTPPWFTGSTHGERSAGGWMADHSSPAAALFLPGTRPRVLLASPVAEDGNGVIWTDLDGNKLDGRRWIGGVWTGATALARDVGARPTPGIYAFAGTGWKNQMRLTAFHDDDTFTPVVTRDATKVPNESLGGLAARDGALLAALPDSGRVMSVDVASGAVAGFAALPGVRALAFDGRGRLLALAGRRLLAFAHPTPSSLGDARVLADGLVDPHALAVGADGAVYVADWGSHQVVVFDAEGRRLRTIGHAGGAVVGPYDPLRMHEPAGLTITSDDHLWVAESSSTPKRVSVWTTAGAFVKAFYGPPQYGGGGFIDPRDRT